MEMGEVGKRKKSILDGPSMDKSTEVKNSTVCAMCVCLYTVHVQYMYNLYSVHLYSTAFAGIWLLNRKKLKSVKCG